MFIVKRNGDNRLDIQFAGKLDSDGMKAALDDLVAKSEGIENGRMLYRIGDFDMPTLGAIGVELSRLPQLFSRIHFNPLKFRIRQDCQSPIKGNHGLINIATVGAYSCDAHS